MIEEKMLILLRQGKVSKWFSGIGQEAISIGVVEALDKDEYILPLHRNLGIFTGRNIPFAKLFAQWQGKFSGFSKGRERSFHFGTNEYHIVGMISHLGAMLGVADGIALANLLKEEKKVTKQEIVTPAASTNNAPIDKDLQKQIQKLQKVIAQLEHNIEVLNKEKIDIELQMADPSIYSDTQKYQVVEKSYHDKNALIRAMNKEYEIAFGDLLLLESK